ncbi:MAG: WecB/TagA/CpsF family glycosyltransferase [Magnetococcales bacterium]|nr:WecB/TagA/CpsF family glycosyltransferase [Magnetococcales bacterium]
MGAVMHPWTMATTVKEIERRLEEGRFTQHVVVNVAKAVSMQDDKKLKEAVSVCDIINFDGMGMVWAGRLLGREVPERVAGIDLYYALLKMAEERQWPVYLLGAREPVIVEVEKRIRALHPKLPIAGCHHGYFWEDEPAMVEAIRTSRAKLLFVAISSPRKETFINRWREELGVDFVMGVGGTFDVMAGVARRAPVWMQNAGLEWFFRLLQEPQRMWRRYLTTNARFLAWLMKELLLNRRGKGTV